MLITTDYTIEGVSIAETLNGPVEIKIGSGYDIIPAGSAVRDHPEGRGRLHAPAPSGVSRRIVRLKRPEAFLYADVRLP